MTDPVRKALPFPDGTVSYLDWPGDGPALHFAHATGFNAQTYRALLDPLADRLHLLACDSRGHGFTTLPATDGATLSGWTLYRDDLARNLDALNLAPAILCGHSMGATVSLMAAVLRPERVRALVLVEPVMIPSRLRYLQWLAGLLGLKRPNLADRAAQRRDRFPSRDAALAAYTGRGAFRSWPTATIADYLAGGLIADGDAMRLACAPAWEAATFRAAPFGIARLARRVQCPIVVLRGTIASTCADSEAALFRRAGARVVTVDGASHFLPMERPEMFHDEVARLLETS